MASYINTKKALKGKILGAIDEVKSVDKDKLVAQLCLDTGFREITIKKIISQLAELEYIKVDGLVISRPDNQKLWVCASCGNKIRYKIDKPPVRCDCGRKITPEELK